MKKRSFYFLFLCMLLAFVIDANLLKDGNASLSVLIIIPTVAILVGLFFVFIDFVDFIKTKDTLPPVPISGIYACVKGPLADAFHFKIVEIGGKYFRADNGNFDGYNSVHVHVNNEFWNS